MIRGVFGVLVFRVRAEEGACALSSLRPFGRARFVLGLVGVSYKMRHAAYNMQPVRSVQFSHVGHAVLCVQPECNLRARSLCDTR
jgi:hypothetical protein